MLLGRSIDLVGTELPYQPFVEALRPLGEHRPLDGRTAGSQLRRVRGDACDADDRADEAPVLLVLEDLHWADTSTLDLVVFLSHNLEDRRVLLLATYRADELSSAERMRRLADGVRRSGAALLVELGPLARDELSALFAAHGRASTSAALTDAIVDRSEGNPFFAEELLAAASEGEELPHGLRDLLLDRIARLDRPTQDLLRLAAAAGRDVGYPLLRDVAMRPERDVRESLRQAVEHGVLVVDQETGSFRFRHALLAEAVYATILPGEREELHARLAHELARVGGAAPAELAPHWAAAGRPAEALAASVDAAHQAEAVFGLAEAHTHLERALALWPTVPDAVGLAGLDLAGLYAWAAELSDHVGAASRAVELAGRAIDLVGVDDPHRAALLHVDLGEYLLGTGNNDAALAAVERAVALVPAEPPSPERAYALGTFAGLLMVVWRHSESLPVSEHALALARDIGAREAEVRALTVLGTDLAYLGRGDQGLARFPSGAAARRRGRRSPRLWSERTSTHGRADDARTTPRVGAIRAGGAGRDTPIRDRQHSPSVEPDRVAARERRLGRGRTAQRCRAPQDHLELPHSLLMIRADFEIGRGEFDAAREHLEAASATLSEDPVLGLYDAYRADLALWERRWTDADAASHEGLTHARLREAAQIRVQICAKGLRAQAELAALARARRDAGAVRRRLDRAGQLLDTARRAAEKASAVTPNATAWLTLAEAEYERAEGDARPDSWSEAAAIWERLERPPLAAYCRWRQAEALVASGASRAEASLPLKEAHTVAARIRAQPLVRELELLAQRARLDLTPPDPESVERNQDLEDLLGLTPRETEVLMLVARGYTNQEIADTLVISVKTASVHVSHILRKLNAPNRREAAAISHRLAPPPRGEPEIDA